jgi:ribonuclease T1
MHTTRLPLLSFVHSIYAVAKFAIFNVSLMAIAFALCLFVLSMPNADARESSTLSSGLPEIAFAELPKEAKATLALIRSGGPFPYDKDGVMFGNREKVLPKQRRGYYSEYTVRTPGAKNRGARRLVVGGEPKTSFEVYYTDDHYQSFKRIKEN